MPPRQQHRVTHTKAVPYRSSSCRIGAHCECAQSSPLPRRSASPWSTRRAVAPATQWPPVVTERTDPGEGLGTEWRTGHPCRDHLCQRAAR